MTVQITIIGLGQIGSSIGLALKARNVNVHILGHDKDPQVAKRRRRRGQWMRSNTICRLR
jgi:prephenate dehydrogenase